MSHKNRKTHEQFVKDVYELYGDDYSILGIYVTQSTKIKVRHNICGHEIFIIPKNFLKGQSKSNCIKCKKYYRKSHDQFISEIELKFGKNSLLIEFQGEQHEKYIEGFHPNIEKFYKQQEHDKRKRQYAIDNGIKLLEIWYWDFDNIESVLEKELI
jgi:hypothetical protein